MDEINRKNRNMIKVLLTALINKDKEIYAFSKTLQRNKNLYRFVAEPNEVILFSEIAEALELKTEKECEQMYNELCKIASSKKNINDEVEKFMNKYSL